MDREWFVADPAVADLPAELLADCDAITDAGMTRILAVRRSVLPCNLKKPGVRYKPIDVDTYKALPMVEPVPGRPGIVQRATQAAAAIAQNIVQINQRPAEEIERVQAICKGCPERGQLVVAWCKECGCVLSQKLKNAGTECPVGKWGKWQPQSASDPDSPVGANA